MSPELAAGTQRDVGRRVRLGRWWAGAASAVQAVGLVALSGFYVVELSWGRSDDPTRVVMSVILFAAAALALALLARGWWRGRAWTRMPTVVWNLLLLPPAWSILQAGQVGLLLAVAGTAVVALVGVWMSTRAPGASPRR